MNEIGEVKSNRITGFVNHSGYEVNRSRLVTHVPLSLLFKPGPLVVSSALNLRRGDFVFRVNDGKVGVEVVIDCGC